MLTHQSKKRHLKAVVKAEGLEIIVENELSSDDVLAEFKIYSQKESTDIWARRGDEKNLERALDEHKK